MAPPMFRQLRKRLAKPSMICQDGGCTTAAFAPAVRLEKCPTVSIRTRDRRSWLETLRSKARTGDRGFTRHGLTSSKK